MKNQSDLKWRCELGCDSGHGERKEDEPNMYFKERLTSESFVILFSEKLRKQLLTTVKKINSSMLRLFLYGYP